MIQMSKVIPSAFEYVTALPDTTYVHAGKRILVYAFTPQWIAYLALISTILVQRGCRIDFVWSRPFEHDNANQETYARQILHEIEPTLSMTMHPGFRSIDLGTVPLSALGPELGDEVEQQTIEDSVHQSREIRIDVDGDHRNLFRRRKHLNQICMAALKTIVEENDYDAILTANGKVFEFGIAYRLARHCRIPICTIESFWGGTDEQLAISWDQPAIMWDKNIVADAWKSAEPHVATAEVHRNVAILASRFANPKDDIADQFCEGGRVPELRNDLNLSPDKPVVLVLPSLGHEKHFRLEHYVFKDHVEWFEETVLWLARREDCQVVIRSHPFPYDSRKDPMNHGASREIPDRVIRELFGEMPSHFRFIGAQEEVNTYDLMEIGDCVLTHHSVTALEMALRGKPAVICSSIHYAEKGFTIGPRSRAEYFSAIDGIVKDPDRGRLDDRQVELASCYADVFYFKWPKPFPWSIFRPNFLYDRWPIHKTYSLAFLLSPFIDSFDNLVEEREISDEVRRREFETIMQAIRHFVDSGQAHAADLLLGDIAGVDIARIMSLRPDENAGEKVSHGSGGMIPRRAA